MKSVSEHLSSNASLFAKVLAGLLLILSCQESLGQGNARYEMEVLGEDNLVEGLGGSDEKVSGANRVLEEADETPARTYVFTREQIQQNGFTGLVDILKTIPGFRTSQPGSALLGETFMSRGMLGNVYTKILVDGVPITPSTSPGMPIAHQLPIQAAERIEVILGPAAAAYGADAMAGVINIITSRVERPVEATGSIGIGTSGRNILNLNLGGKSGKGKNIVEFNFFATSYLMEDWRLMWGDTAAFYVDTVRLANNNIFSGDGQVPRMPPIAHESRMLGAKVEFRGLSYSYHNLFREDHNSLGTHPQDVAHHLAFTNFEESIGLHRVSYQKTMGKLWLNTNFSAVNYESDPRNSYRAILHPLANGTTHQYGQSLDFQLEQIGNFSVNSRLDVLVGGALQRQKGMAYQDYIERPFSNDITVIDAEGREVIANAVTPASVLEEFSPVARYNLLNFGFFGQVYYHSDKLRLIGGGRFDRAGRQGLRFSPKASALWKVSRRFWVRGMYAEAFRLPGEYYRANNYRGVAVQGGAPGALELERYNQPLLPETLRNFELGLDYKLADAVTLRLHHFTFFRTGTIFNRIRTPDPLDPAGMPADFYSVNYYNNESESQLSTTQAMVVVEKDWGSLDASVEYSVGEEQMDSIFDVDYYREVPKWAGSVNAHVNLPWKIRISVYSKFFGSYNWTLKQVNRELYQKTAEGYYNIDLSAHIDLSKRLGLYARVTNLTRTQVRGLLSNDLSGYQYPYIPQPGRHLLAGLTFDLNRESERQ